MVLLFTLACLPKTPPATRVEPVEAPVEVLPRTIEVNDLRLLESRVVADPEDAESWLAMAWLHQREGRSELAALCAARASTLGSESPAWLNERGLGQLRQGDALAATRSFQEALELDPGFRDARLNLGALALQHADFVDARRQFQAVLARHPQDVDAQLGLSMAEAGLSAAERGRAEQAAESTRRREAALRRGVAELDRRAALLEGTEGCEPMVAEHLRAVARRADVDEVRSTLQTLPSEDAELLGLACP